MRRLQKRLPKFRRAPEGVVGKTITARGLAIIEIIGRYRCISTKDIVRLAGGNEDVTYRHLQQLYHQDLISRLALPKNGGHGAFIYFLDNPKGLRSLSQNSRLDTSGFDWKQIKANREKREQTSIGRLLFVEHEEMISRFHAGLELAARNSAGRAILSRWTQGSELWDSVQANGNNLPYRPDALFSLEFPNAAEGQRRSNFFYEADRQTSNLTRFKEKLESYLAFLMQGKHRQYGIQKIRAVVVETIKGDWGEQLKTTAGQLASIQPLAAELFWFANSEELAGGNIFLPHFSVAQDDRKRSLLD